MIQQIDAAMDYLKRKDVAEDNLEEFERLTGVGIVISPQEIRETVASVLDSKRDKILEERYAYSLGGICTELRERIRWADSKLVKEELDAQLFKMLGPKTEEDSMMAMEKSKKTKSKKTTSPSTNDPSTVSSSQARDEDEAMHRLFEGDVLKFHKPEENKQLRPEILESHLRETGSKVVTRFPPEPNGFLHIGHAKAINFNFRYAELHEGICYLRYDDTNPEAEEQRYFDSILECVEWLGFRPYRVTASSDYFDRLYELAVDLIRRGKAFICHQTAEEMHAARGGDRCGPRTDSPWRDRPIEESLRLFDDMRNGKFLPGEATLRMKIDMQSGNPYLWDPVAYRVLDKPHPRTGDKWLIYPTYDFTHCLCDSFENITHSLCTTEFQLAREAYYWLCDALEVYRPVQWEYSRLSITNTVLSKRKLLQLVELGHVRGWDDPRLYTLLAVRRRGFTPKAINNFVERLGITTSRTVVNVKLLESCVREDLNRFAIRAMAIIDPVKVIVLNYPENEFEQIVVSNVPHDPSKGVHEIPFGRILYIDRSDFREQDEPDYYRLAPGKRVLLNHAFVIQCEGFKKDPSSGQITEIHVTYDRHANKKHIKGHIQWVAESSAHRQPVIAQLNMYSNLFKSEDPTKAPGGWLQDINPNSLIVYPRIFVDNIVLHAQPEDKFQFERVGYVCVDSDSRVSSTDHLIFNLTVSLKEDPKKN